MGKHKKNQPNANGNQHNQHCDPEDGGAAAGTAAGTLTEEMSFFQKTLDAIEEVRALLPAGSDVSIPQIAVVGNQSVGKSSVLQRLCGCDFVWRNKIHERMKVNGSEYHHLSSAYQRKDVRETVVEMVLATDMGLHAKILNQFKRRLGDEKGRENFQWKKDSGGK
eukprot:gene22659-1355_t